MTGYLASSFLQRREMKRTGFDPFEGFLKLIWVEDMRKDSASAVDHDYCVMACMNHNYCDR